MVFAEDSRHELIERYIYREIHENPDDLAAAGAFEPRPALGRIQRTSGSLGPSSLKLEPASNQHIDDSLTAKVTYK